MMMMIMMMQMNDIMQLICRIRTILICLYHFVNLFLSSECLPPPPIDRAWPKLKQFPMLIGSKIELVCLEGYTSKSLTPMYAECLPTLEWFISAIDCVGKYYLTFRLL